MSTQKHIFIKLSYILYHKQENNDKIWSHTVSFFTHIATELKANNKGIYNKSLYISKSKKGKEILI